LQENRWNRDHHVKLSKPNLETQVSLVLSHTWKEKDMKVEEGLLRKMKGTWGRGGVREGNGEGEFIH
jgi:hypothetical protein